MAKFIRKNKGKDAPGISTASLPDIVFMLLFFFMVSTTMKEITLKVGISIPYATEITKMEKKSLISYIYVGKPLDIYRGKFGTEPRIQLNDQFATVRDIRDYISTEREARNEREQKLMSTSLKIDIETKMGIITDIKQELRKVNALKINYSSKKEID